MPLKSDHSMIGVFPVAMRTIIVSPTARPKPTIRAEKIPAEAVGRMTRVAVCQGDAPRASEARLQVLRDARERVLGDREDDRDDGEPHGEGDDEASCGRRTRRWRAEKSQPLKSPAKRTSSSAGPRSAQSPTRRRSGGGSRRLPEPEIAAAIRGAGPRGRTPRRGRRAAPAGRGAGS